MDDSSRTSRSTQAGARSTPSSSHYINSVNALVGGLPILMQFFAAGLLRTFPSTTADMLPATIRRVVISMR